MKLKVINVKTNDVEILEGEPLRGYVGCNFYAIGRVPRFAIGNKKYMITNADKGLLMTGDYSIMVDAILCYRNRPKYRVIEIN